MVDRRLAALIIAMALSVTPAFSDDSSESAARSKLAMFISSADELYDDAALIVTKLPLTRNAVNRIHESIGRQWLIDERAFQESLVPLLQINADLPNDVADGITRLQQFNRFVLDAVGATYGCHNVEAVAGPRSPMNCSTTLRLRRKDILIRIGNQTWIRGQMIMASASKATMTQYAILIGFARYLPPPGKGHSTN